MKWCIEPVAATGLTNERAMARQSRANKQRSFSLFLALCSSASAFNPLAPFVFSPPSPLSTFWRPNRGGSFNFEVFYDISSVCLEFSAKFFRLSGIFRVFAAAFRGFPEKRSFCSLFVACLLEYFPYFSNDRVFSRRISRFVWHISRIKAERVARFAVKYYHCTGFSLSLSLSLVSVLPFDCFIDLHRLPKRVENRATDISPFISVFGVDEKDASSTTAIV